MRQKKIYYKAFKPTAQLNLNRNMNFEEHCLIEDWHIFGELRPVPFCEYVLEVDTMPLMGHDQQYEYIRRFFRPLNH